MSGTGWYFQEQFMSETAKQYGFLLVVISTANKIIAFTKCTIGANINWDDMIQGYLPINTSYN